MQLAIEKLKAHGVNEIIINIHAFADQIVHFVEKNKAFGIRIEFSDERKKLLDTGGGLLQASHFFDDHMPFIVYNVDVISDIDLSAMLAFHQKQNAMVTMAVRKRQSSRYLLLDDADRLKGWENISTQEQILLSEQKLYRFAFSGIHIINPSIFTFLSRSGAFPIIPVYLELAQKHIISGFDHSATQWMDMGKMGDIEKNMKILKEKNLI